ncbi:MAG: adenylyl-sulfate kinase [Pelagibacterales bacterium]|nr:adenylyl-sulfate kinase [Pelagibacterales bacterium]|tara:strand:- start:2984 stop:3520 length:537 start_codon:yes stop_codon:yes gene_type:complete
MAGKVIWITGLSGSGKTTLALQLTSILRGKEKAIVNLDGDILRKTLLDPKKEKQSYTANDRRQLAQQYGRLCKLISDQGFWVLIATISLFREVHAWNRQNISNYFEVFLDVPMAELRRRDTKGIYRAFSNNGNGNIVGLDLKFDKPVSPDWHEKFDETRSSELVAQDLAGIFSSRGWL